MTNYIVQGWYDPGYGWEDLTWSSSRELALLDLYDYDSNEPQYPHRIIEKD